MKESAAKVPPKPAVVSLAQLLTEQPAAPPPGWIEPGLLSPPGILFVGGEPKVGKSLLVANLALALAAGKDRAGFRIPAARRVLVCQFELPTPQFVGRLAAMRRSVGSAADQNLLVDTRAIGHLLSIGCCTCLVTPNGLNSLSVKSDLISNNLTPAVPTSITISLIASQPTADLTGNLTVCNPATGVVGNVQGNGLVAWGNTLEPTATPGTFNAVPAPFLSAGLSPSELAGVTSACNFIQADGTGYGICKSCRLGALGGAKQ